MSASTSKRPKVNAKLYGYLPGYEAVCFTGADVKTVTRSIRVLINDDLKILLEDQEIPQEKINLIFSNIDKFFVRFYDRMSKRKPGTINQLADFAKEDKQLLESIVCNIIGTVECPTTILGFDSLGRNAAPMDICEKCPWYIDHRFCLIYGNEYMDELIPHIYKFHNAEYRYLALAMLKLVHVLTHDLEIPMVSMGNYYQLFTDILACGQIYELMNPSGEEREEYLSKSLDILKGEPIQRRGKDYEYYHKLLHLVFEDIRIGKRRYVREFHKLWKNLSPDTVSKFDPERDYYYSMKGTGQSKFTDCRYSLQSSAFEVDMHKHDQRVIDFDTFIQYQSKYRELKEGENPPKVIVKTIGINNPGKFKPRIIHIADNPLQDRCNWLHRRLSEAMKIIKTDCTDHQEWGREFSRNLTAQWFMAYPYEDRIGITNTDFSEATDRMDQVFTHEVLEFFMGPEVANFWDYVSELEKTFFHADGTQEDYLQKTGQPQGFLASFRVFALCHHILFLMDMKEFELTNYSIERYYRVLGDDSSFNTIIREKDYLDLEDILDDEGYRRNILEISHFDKCQILAGLKINLSKTTSVHWDDPQAKVEFAKVTYRNGRLFSPTPFRLAMNYANSFDSKFAVCIWRADRKDNNAIKLLNQILLDIPEDERQEYYDLIRCGELPFLSEFYDQTERSDYYISCVRYCYFISLLSAGLAFTITGDKQRSKSSYDLYEESMRTIFTKGQEMRLNNIDINHKVMLLLESNSEILELFHEIYSQEDFDSQFLTMCLASLLKDEKEDVLWMIHDVASFRRMLDMAKDNPIITGDYLREIMPLIGSANDYKRDITHISNRLLTRGITKRPGESSYIFRKTINLLKELHQQLQWSFDESA